MVLTRQLTTYLTDYYRTQKNALLLTGARQTGKTYAIRELGKSFQSFIEINFIETPEAVNIFRDVNSADEILLRLSALTDRPLVKGNTLIFFDEVQNCDSIVTAIKFLVEEGSYRYALSGSLLGVELKEIKSVPVGFMGIKEVYPLDFREFITNLGVAGRVLEHLEECWKALTPVDPVIHERILSLFRLYIIIGGMPGAVAKYLESMNIGETVMVQKDIVELYRRDISKYADKEKLKIREIFDIIPSELDARNKRFILKRLNEHAKFDRYRNDFLWLSNAGVAIPVYNVETPVFPLKLAELRNLFKLFANDVGLLTSRYADGIQLKLLSGETSINYGAVYENCVAEELLTHGFTPYYFNSKKLGEIDFIISEGDRIIPIEVKSGKDYDRHNALNNVVNCGEYGTERGLVLCHGNMEVRGKIIYAPIYMTMFLKKNEELPGKYIPDLRGLI